MRLEECIEVKENGSKENCRERGCCKRRSGTPASSEHKACGRRFTGISRRSRPQKLQITDKTHKRVTREKELEVSLYRKLNQDMANGDNMPALKEDSNAGAKRLRASEVDVKTMTPKQYMDELVVPTMLRALSAVNKERPDDPIEFLIAYLSKERERSSSPTGTPEISSAAAADAKPVLTKEEKI